MKTVCCICQRRRIGDDVWIVAPPVEKRPPEPVSHGYCPDCFRIMMEKTMRNRLHQKWIRSSGI